MKQSRQIMSPGIGLMKRRLEKEKDAVALAISGIAKKYDIKPEDIKTLETKYHDDAGDWYVALGWEEKRAIVQMDSVLGTIIEIKSSKNILTKLKFHTKI
jgi:hypothetical protein